MEGSTEGHGEAFVRIGELSPEYGRDICLTNGWKKLLHFYFWKEQDTQSEQQLGEYKKKLTMNLIPWVCNDPHCLGTCFMSVYGRGSDSNNSHCRL